MAITLQKIENTALPIACYLEALSNDQPPKDSAFSGTCCRNSCNFRFFIVMKKYYGSQFNYLGLFGLNSPIRSLYYEHKDTDCFQQTTI